MLTEILYPELDLGLPDFLFAALFSGFGRLAAQIAQRAFEFFNG